MDPLPDEAKVRTPGFSRASATKSSRDLAATLVFAISRNGVLAIVATVRKSWIESKDKLGYRLGFTAWDPAYVTSSVYPSGLAFATASVPTTPAAPARFSTMTGWPHRSVNS